MVELELTGVTKRFGATTAVEDLTLTVADGEFVTLVGPSGCGKTTTLRLVAGLERPDAGTVRLDGEPVAGPAWRDPERRDVGVVFQSYALFPHMSVAENVAYGLRFRDPPGGGTSRERVRELLDLVDLTGMGERDPTALSGGQRQRVALARALAPGPGVLLLDEPMSALDARLRESLRRQVREIQRELGITTLYVTHDQEEAMATSDRLGVMSEGRLEGVGRPRDLYRRPPSRFVASFLGESNLFEGRVRAVERDAERELATVDVGDRAVTVAVGSTTPTDAGGEEAVTPGDAVTVCVRPEALSPTESRNRIEVAVEGTEFLGEAVRAWGEWDGRRVVVRLRDPPGDGVAVGFDPGAAHLLVE
jgi:thiamine transport system ATP-binding protein